MTLLAALAAALAAAGASPAEGRPEPEVLLAGEVEHGGYGGPEMKFGAVRGQGAFFLGGRGGWIINHSLVIGGAGYALTNRIAAPDAAQPAIGRYDITFGYGGVMLEGIVLPRNLWHLAVGSLIGAGGVTYMDHDMRNAQSHSTAGVFVWEPSVTLEINVVRFMRIDLGVSWRMVRGVDLTGLANSDLTGFAGLLAFKFGKF